MKVLQIVKTNEGAAWSFDQALWLFNNGVDIVTVLPSVEGGIAEKYKSNGMSIAQGDFSLPITKPWKLLRRIREIKMLINEVKPDIIHCHFVTNIMMLRIALTNSSIPRLFQVPGPLHLESWLYRKAEIILSKNNDYWAGACNQTCNIYLKSGISKKRVYLAYYGGYGGKTANEYLESQCLLRNEYDIPKEKTLVGMVSYFYKPKVHLLQSRGLKGHEDFIDAISIVREKHPNVLGIVIGDAWGNSSKYVDKVKKYGDFKLGNEIIFTGFRSDMKKIYKEIDIAVHPSHSENLGGAAESLAAGVATISTNVGGFPDIVIDDKTGYTVNAKSPLNLAEAIIKSIENPIKSSDMSENGKQLVIKVLDIENTGKAVFNIYNKIVNEGIE